MMRISVVGMGYVGTVSGACLAEAGHTVVVVDVNETKLALLNSGRSPISEPGVDELVAANVAAGRLSATADITAAVQGSDATIVCVGTPTGPRGDVRLADVCAVVGQIGRALRATTQWHLVVVTSTVPPGTVDGVIAPLLAAESGKRRGSDFGLAFAPEFLREGTAVADFRRPAKTVLGTEDDRAYAAALDIYRPFAGEPVHTDIRVAEMVKFTDNCWHALKVAYANEVGRICDALGIDSHAVMDIFRRDQRLNISPTYLRPGFAFGGSCLPKDLRTLTFRAKASGVDVPVLSAILPSNDSHLELAFRKVNALDVARVALLGIAFKPGTDDLRESPAVALAQRLLAKGYAVRVHDEHVTPADLLGANRAFVDERLPQLAALMDDDLDRVIASADAVVVSQSNPSYADLMTRVPPDVPVVDLTGVARPAEALPNYHGLLW